MPLTRSFKDTVVARAQKDSAFRVGVLQEAIDAFLEDDLETGKSLLRDYVNATLGFRALGAAVSKDPKSLMRMLGDGGNPRADSLFAVIAHLQSREGIALSVGALSRHDPR